MNQPTKTATTATMASTGTIESAPGATFSGARRRVDSSLVGQLNREWAALRVDTVSTRSVARWTETSRPLQGCTSLADIESRVSEVDRASADQILLSLLELAAAGEQLAGRTVLQLMLGKAVRIASAQNGRADRQLLEQLAVAALWDVIATYPIQRRRTKVAANLAMDTLRQVVRELSPDRQETPVEPETFGYGSAFDEDAAGIGTVSDLELLEVLMWGVDHGVLSREDATLLVRVYCPAPGAEGGAAVAAELGLTWAAARQRCSRAIRRLTAAVRADALEVEDELVA